MIRFLYLIFFTNLIYCAIIPEQNSESSDLVKIENSENERKFSYVLDDGQSRQETISIINAGTEDEYIEVRGSYSYSDGNRIYTVEYTADKNGYTAKTSSSAGGQAAPAVVFLDPNIAKSLIG